MKLMVLILAIGVWSASGCRRLSSEDNRSSEDESNSSGDTDTAVGFNGETDVATDTAAATDSETSDTSFPRVDPCENPVTETDEDGNLYVTAEAAQNYTFSSSISVETITVRSSSNLLFDWSDVTTDMYGKPMDPLTGVDMMVVWFFRPKAKEELLRELSEGNLEQWPALWLSLETENAISSGYFLDTSISEGSPAEFFMNILDVERSPPEECSYLFVVAEGTDTNKGMRLLTSFQLDPDEENTEVRLSDASASMEYEVDIGRVYPIAIPSGRSDIVFDWRDVSGALGTDALGGEWISTKITNVMIFHYADKTVEDLEANFFDLKEMADETWSIYLMAGQSVALSRLETESGETFEGIDETGMWIITLVCGYCRNPAPLFLSVLYPCGE